MRVTKSLIKKCHKDPKSFRTQLAAMEAERKKIDRRMHQLQIDIANMRDFLLAVNSIIAWHKGEPIANKFCNGKESVHLGSVVPQNHRTAHAYLNQHDRKSWGLCINDYDMEKLQHKWQGDLFLGCGWPSSEAALHAAMEWIACGVMPERTDEKACTSV
jgi:hypothetical protein